MIFFKLVTCKYIIKKTSVRETSIFYRLYQVHVKIALKNPSKIKTNLNSKVEYNLGYPSASQSNRPDR